ncbi:NAD(P)-dependent oxidoreductase [Solirubrobacter sp. CPCC 204708]|uniref:NAD(P)-dependent oxidoreductase n=1 Tax=Solirubrobacter deserti TaxID=2282478 RepID=A0ABT4RG22_9ACTN|nr:NAD(P)-dependent oxidoreductase [Solirubrobacter deserti]MBE2318198.1 NAD(P)-dependent oxidoreductase [Solirubrobacter deserti]MDA0137479.1 NAD(P)-dependent oxidoreductase [Solirubrobacter deserti]
MERVLITGAAGAIGTVLRPALREGLRELRLTDVVEIDDLAGNETFVRADLTDFEAVQRAVEGVTAVVHLGAVPNEAPFDVIAGPNLHGAYHVFEAARRADVDRIVYASSNHATGMYPVGEPLDGTVAPWPDGLYGASKVFGEALARMYVTRFGMRAVCLRIGSFKAQPQEERELSTWLSHADGIRLFQAALTADVEFAIVYGASANTRRWWPADTEIGFVPQDDAETFAPLPPSRFTRQGGPNTERDHGGWAT